VLQYGNGSMTRFKYGGQVKFLAFDDSDSLKYAVAYVHVVWLCPNKEKTLLLF